MNPAIQASSNGELTAVASRDAERAQAFAEQWDIPAHYGSYQALLNDAMLRELRVLRPSLVVYDECHKLKGAKGRTSKAARKMERSADRIIGLTGTLMPHSPLDAWGIYRAIAPAALGDSYWRFFQRYAVRGGFEGKQVIGPGATGIGPGDTNGTKNTLVANHGDCEHRLHTSAIHGGA